ncbi:MAG: SRPBCC family protein [Longimicrobiaceae bacterium]
MSTRPTPHAGVAAALSASPAAHASPPAGLVFPHVERAHAIRVEAPPARAFALFEPVGEKLWAAGWHPEFLHPADGEAREGAVFLTRAAGEPATVWMIALHRPEEHHVAYARITPGIRAVRVDVRCRPDGTDATLATVAYEYTALSEEPDPYLEGLDEARYREGIEAWGGAIAHHLRHGTAPADPGH